MIKSVRTFALVAVLSFVAVPSMMANRMGCNPHPQVEQTTSVLASAAQAALALLGL